MLLLAFILDKILLCGQRQHCTELVQMNALPPPLSSSLKGASLNSRSGNARLATSACTRPTKIHYLILGRLHDLRMDLSDSINQSLRSATFIKESNFLFLNIEHRFGRHPPGLILQDATLWITKRLNYRFPIQAISLTSAEFP